MDQRNTGLFTRVRSLRVKAEKELGEMKTEIQDIRGKWKKVARDLNRMRTRKRGFYQVADIYLIDLVICLRSVSGIFPSSTSQDVPGLSQCSQER